MAEVKGRRKTSKPAASSPKIGDVATFEVVAPFCGLIKGERRKVRVSAEVLYTMAEGFLKIVTE